MTDDDRLRELDRDLAAALDVRPSPDLLPRIRERLAGEAAAPGVGMRLAALFACGVLAVGAGLVFYTPAEQPGGSAGFAERNPPDVRRPGLALQTRRPPAHVVGATRLSAVASAKADASPADALRPSSDLAAIEQFMAVATLDEPLIAGTLDDPPPADIQVAELSVMPLEVTPLTPNE